MATIRTSNKSTNPIIGTAAFAQLIAFRTCLLYTSVRKIAKKKEKCEKQAIDNECAIELEKDELKLCKGLLAEMFK